VLARTGPATSNKETASQGLGQYLRSIHAHVVEEELVWLKLGWEAMGKRSAKGVFVRHDLALFLLVSGVVFFFVDYHRLLLPFPNDLHALRRRSIIEGKKPKVKANSQEDSLDGVDCRGSRRNNHIFRPWSRSSRTFRGKAKAFLNCTANSLNLRGKTSRDGVVTELQKVRNDHTETNTRDKM
jgi:hypothetical protein